MTIVPLTGTFKVGLAADFTYSSVVTPAPVLSIISNIKPNESTKNIQENTCDWIVSLSYLKSYDEVAQCDRDIQMLKRQIEFLNAITDNLERAREAIILTKKVATKTYPNASNYNG